MNSPLLARGGVLIKLDRERVLFFSMQSTWQLVQRYGMHFITALYKASESEGGTAVELKDMDALLFFLWVGLQTEAEATGETLTLEQTAEFITPYTLPGVFNTVVTALMRDVSIAALPGKAEAATASPAPAAMHPGPTKASTLTTRSAPPSRSAGRGKPSGRQRHGS